MVLWALTKSSASLKMIKIMITPNDKVPFKEKVVKDEYDERK